MKTLILDVSIVKPALFGSHTNNHLMQDKNSNLLVTYMYKKEFKDNGHVRSGKYFLPLSPNLTVIARRSSLLSSLIFMSFTDPCRATYQSCFPTAPMLRYQSPKIVDISPMKIKYWNNSVNLANLVHVTHEITHYGLSENEWILSPVLSEQRPKEVESTPCI